MHYMLYVLQYALSSALVVTGGYMAILTLGAWRYRGPKAPSAAHKVSRIAVLIPAHDEGAGVRRTIDDLLRNDYPSDAYEIFVIADNCTDDTAAHARESGATVIERQDPERRGKAWALDWLLRQERLRLEKFDLISLVDADMKVSPSYLTASAAAFGEAGVEVVQGRYTMDNASESFYAAMGFMSYAYVNHVRPAGRCYWGGTADLKGSGMTFRAGLLLERGWPCKSLAEDVHFGKLLYLDGIRILYAPRAVVTSEIPPHREQVAVQQRRWEAGRGETLRAILVPSLRALATHPSFGRLDALLDLLTPSLSVVVGTVLVSGALALAGYGSPIPAGIALFGFGAAVLTGLIQLRAPRRLYLQLLRAPAFVIWKLALLARVRLLGGPSAWTRTPRPQVPREEP
jgi:cellulose synthase/poly-beta-1,6-N-acetylglucosamine synthase-like glycosyltransferase